MIGLTSGPTKGDSLSEAPEKPGPSAAAPEATHSESAHRHPLPAKLPHAPVPALRPHTDWRENITVGIAVVAAVGSLVGGFGSWFAYQETREYVKLTRQMLRQANSPALAMESSSVQTIDETKRSMRAAFVVMNRGSGAAQIRLGMSYKIGGHPRESRPLMPIKQIVSPGAQATTLLAIMNEDFDAVSRGEPLEVELVYTYGLPGESETREYRFRGVHRASSGNSFDIIEDG